MALSRRPGTPTAYVGVLAKTAAIASSIVRELNIQRAIPIGMTSSTPVRGAQIQCLLVDDSAWPLTKKQEEEILPALTHHAGYVLRLERHDPR